MVIELYHATAPRYLMVDELPERVTIEDLGTWRYGEPMLSAFSPVDVVYKQPDGEGTDWLPEAAT